LITTAATLERARVRWKMLRPGDRAFHLAVSVLDAAICQSDVVFALNLPNFFVKRLNGNPDVYEILTNNEVILGYRLIELSADAEVEILP